MGGWEGWEGGECGGRGGGVVRAISQNQGGIRSSIDKILNPLVKLYRFRALSANHLGKMLRRGFWPDFVLISHCRRFYCYEKSTICCC
mmetsp:Transcript_7412/g.11149  ORF Transcript_7412/g.11149 Transcript_7412/m.11149 type:complete len:88 (+) Transcript_7412:331-594(+)